MMEGISITSARLKAARDNHERDYEAQITMLDAKEGDLQERLSELNEKRNDPDHANFDAVDGDLVEVNAGGKIISAKRSTLTQLKGSRFEALFSGRWDKILQRDSYGRIFLDVNPTCLRAIVDYLSELAISSEDDVPKLSSMDDEHNHILMHQRELFGLSISKMPDSNIIKSESYATLLHNWLEEDGSDGDLNLLYRGSRDGLLAAGFHSKCDNQGCTVTIIETTDGFVFGGYSNTPWTNAGGSYQAANKAFLFVLAGSDISSPCKMKLKDSNTSNAVYNHCSYGPTFGGGGRIYDLNVKNDLSLTVSLCFGNTYESSLTGRLVANGPASGTSLTIKEMEVFEVSGSEASPQATNENQHQSNIPDDTPVNRFSKDINEAINARKESLLQAELEMLHLEDNFKDEQNFITSFASGDAKDVVTLNVSGEVMVTKRSTLCTAEGSVLAQQFDDSRWTEQGCNTPRVKEWTVDDVSDWAANICGIQENASSILKENDITGCELLALKKDGLVMLGITRTGTLCLLLEEIKMLKQASQDVVTLIEHSPYCFGKILDYLRLKQLHSQWFVEEPALPKVCDSQQSRFEKVVKYYFPGNSSKFILG